MYDGALGRLVDRAAERLEEAIRTDSPSLAPGALGWLGSLTRTGRTADYFKHDRRFPMLLLPWWSLPEAEHDSTFFGDVVYSTMAGYCYIRLIDDLVDRRQDTPLDLLPLTALLHCEFQSGYQRHFPAGSPFWALFRESWLRSADAMIAKDLPTASDPVALVERATRTIGAAVIPLYAVLLHAGAADRYPAWRAMVFELARLEQLIDDVTDWLEDFRSGIPNVLLAEGSKRARPDESVMTWVAREGYRWGLDMAASRVDEARRLAETLNSAPLLAFVASRSRAIETLRRETEPGLMALAALGAAFDTPSG